MSIRNSLLLSGGRLDAWSYPSRISDLDFGMSTLDSDILSPYMYSGLAMRPINRASIGSADQSAIKNDPDRFRVMLNISHFKPAEIQVKVVDNALVVHGKHEERTDQHGFVSREFTRRYPLPEGTESETVKSSFGQDGILIIEAAKKAIEPPKGTERIVPLTMRS